MWCSTLAGLHPLNEWPDHAVWQRPLGKWGYQWQIHSGQLIIFHVENVIENVMENVTLSNHIEYILASIFHWENVRKMSACFVWENVRKMFGKCQHCFVEKCGKMLAKMYSI